jgi:hypothetical protein
VIRKRTWVWLILLVAFSVALSLHKRPKFCVADDTTGRVECTYMLESLPVWVDICALGWLVSATAFPTCLAQDLIAWRKRRKGEHPTLS